MTPNTDPMHREATERDPGKPFCEGGAGTCEVCVGSCGVEEYEGRLATEEWRCYDCEFRTTEFQELARHQADFVHRVHPGPFPIHTEATKQPCLYPLPDGRRCCECDNCQGHDRLATFAESGYDYERILDLMQRVRDCADLAQKYLNERTLGGSSRTRGYVSQIEVDAKELHDLLLARHLEIQKAES